MSRYGYSLFITIITFVSLYLIFCLTWFFTGDDINRWIDNGVIDSHNFLPTFCTLVTAGIGSVVLLKMYFSKDRPRP